MVDFGRSFRGVDAVVDADDARVVDDTADVGRGLLVSGVRGEVDFRHCDRVERRVRVVDLVRGGQVGSAEFQGGGIVDGDVDLGPGVGGGIVRQQRDGEERSNECCTQQMSDVLFHDVVLENACPFSIWL